MSIYPKSVISTAPFLHDQATTPKIMWEVVYTLIPIIAVSVFFFGLSAILMVLVCSFTCMATEWYFARKSSNLNSIWDGSALITGILLALTLPPGFPLWMACLGSIVAIGMGKVIWGGLGQNVFNPALLGRAFLQAAFPTAITTWEYPDGKYLATRGTNLALPFFQGDQPDATSAATPLAQMKFDNQATDIVDLLIGNVSGSLGETCGLLLVMAGLYLVVRKIINWRIPVSILVTIVIINSALYSIAPLKYPSPLFMLFSGGLMLGVVYMATDLVTSPLTNKGCWIFGVGIGIFIVLIRIWGGLPEGVMYAILLMNAATPLINRFTKIRVFGHQ